MALLNKIKSKLRISYRKKRWPGLIEAYPTKSIILDVNALSKVMNKVESISELLAFFTNSPIEKIKSN